MCVAFDSERGKYDNCPLSLHFALLHLPSMETIDGMHAMQWAREISKLPDGCFTISFFPYSRTTNTAIAKMKTMEGCKYRKQLPYERFSIGSDNLFLFSDAKGNPKMCYCILIRYMGFPQDGFKLHKVKWL